MWVALTVVTVAVLVLLLVATSISTSRFHARERQASAAFDSGVTTLVDCVDTLKGKMYRNAGSASIQNVFDATLVLTISKGGFGDPATPTQERRSFDQFYLFTASASNMRSMLAGPEFGTCVDQYRRAEADLAGAVRGWQAGDDHSDDLTDGRGLSGSAAWPRIGLGVLGAVLDDLGCPRGILRPISDCA